MDFVQKSKFLLWLFFTEIMSEKIVFRYSGQKKMIIRPNNIRFKKIKKWTFLQRGQSINFVQESKFLLRLFFTNIMSEKIVIRYSAQKTMIIRPKNLSFKKGQKWTFLQRGQSMDFVQKSKFLLWLFFTEVMSEKIVF